MGTLSQWGKARRHRGTGLASRQARAGWSSGCLAFALGDLRGWQRFRKPKREEPLGNTQLYNRPVNG